MADEWGPLGALAGEWEAEGGLDAAFSHSRGEVLATPYTEKLTLKPFGPVDNGASTSTASTTSRPCGAASEENPFHTEVGYWLWDAATGEVMRGFVVPRGITVLAGGTAAPDATSFTLSAKAGDPQYSIGENKYLAAHASTLSYDVTITIHDADSWSYDETTMLRMDEFPEPFAHTDHNRLRRIA